MDTWLSYAPVKNNPEDAAKTHYEVFNGQEVEVWPRIVWKPKWGLTFAEIRSKVSGSCSITQRSTMAIKGRNIFVKDLSLDGALVIDSIDEAEKKEAPTMLDWCANNHTKYWGAAETEHLQRYFST